MPDTNELTMPAIPEAAVEAALDAQRAVIANDHDRMQVALFAALPHLVMPADTARATHRHKKRGTEYVLIGYGRMQAEGWVVDNAEEPFGSKVDMREVAIYRSATDPTEIWVRPREEFEDGRFEVLR